jgi:Protein of unknown function (DUF992)
MLRYGANVLALVLATATIDPAPAQRIRAGLLTCDVSADIGFIIGSKKEMACVFTPEGPSSSTNYLKSLALPRGPLNSCPCVRSRRIGPAFAS